MKRLLIALSLLSLTSCMTVKTNVSRNYEWDNKKSDYLSTSDINNIKSKFRLKPVNNKIKFTVGDKKNFIDLINKDFDQSNKDVEVYIYDGFLNGEIPCRVAYYPDGKMIIIFGNHQNDRYQSIVLFN